MELDPRIIEGKKPLDCFDVDIARQFIGKKGYFGLHTSQFMDLDLCPKCVVDELKEIDEYDNSPFISAGGCCYSYFLPAKWVKEPEKKYRPFTNEEFLNLFDSGKLHSIRKKNVKGRYIITNVYYFNDECFVKLNSDCGGFGMVFLVNNGYEYFDGKDWKPFGVEENESAKWRY